MKRIWLPLLLLLTSARGYADADISDSINELPIFWGLLDNSPRYRNAAFKAQEAFFVHSGVAHGSEQFADYLNSKAQSAEQGASVVIRNYTPLDPKYVFFALAISYNALVNKEVSRSFKNPVFPGVMNTLTVSESQQSLVFNIPF